VEFVNIREQCAWVHKDDPAIATRKATDIILAGINRAKVSLPVIREERTVEGSAMILGTGLSSLAAARVLATQGYSVALVSSPESKSKNRSSQYLERKASLLEQLEKQGIPIMPWPQSLELNGSAGSYEAVLRYRSQTSHIKAGAVILDVRDIEAGDSAIPKGSLLARILARKSCSDDAAAVDSATLRGFTIKETAGIFIISSNQVEPPEAQVIKGTSTAARASVYLAQSTLSIRATAVTINSKLCRGCGDCAAICPYIEMIVSNSGTACAYVDQALCLGCGACISRCPTGAIAQNIQSDRQITSTLEALLGVEHSLSGAG
jgi:heterodisulfide reductase subunit A-like polyferredoxin